jgi:hypothetical protein
MNRVFFAKDTQMKQEIDVFTNSSNSILIINLLKVPVRNCCMNMYNISGKLIKQVKIYEKNTSIKIDSLPPGSYLLIFNLGRKIKAIRFLKE